MYGPPPSPRQVEIAASVGDLPEAWLASLLVGVVLVAVGLWLQRRNEMGAAALVILGHVLALTAPATALLERSIWGAWPTVDKAGSFLFYLDGVQWRPFSAGALDDPSLALIGIHVGHLWITALLDLVLSTHGAFNAQALLQVVLAWFCGWLLMRDLQARPWPALLASFPFAMGLHVFRDVNFYTIEKSAVFGIPLFLWAMNRARTRGGWWIAAAALALLGGALINWYLALVCVAFLGLWLLGAHDKRSLATAGLCSLVIAPLVVFQALLLHDAGALSDPQRFLWERSALDVLSIWPPEWYHLELWRALNLPLMLLGAWSLWRLRDRTEARFGAAVVVTLGLLALGPMLIGEQGAGVPNPVFWAAWKLIPGFWRVARPEFLFEGAWLCLLVAAALAIGRWRLSRGAMLSLHALLLMGWIWGVRSHPAYPGFCEPVEVELSPTWEDGVFREP